MEEKKQLPAPCTRDARTNSSWHPPVSLHLSDCCHYCHWWEASRRGRPEVTEGSASVLAEPTAVAAEVKAGWASRSQRLTTSHLACGRATARRWRPLPAHHLHRAHKIQGSAATPCWLNKKCNVTAERVSSAVEIDSVRLTAAAPDCMWRFLESVEVAARPALKHWNSKSRSLAKRKYQTDSLFFMNNGFTARIDHTLPDAFAALTEVVSHTVGKWIHWRSQRKQVFKKSKKRKINSNIASVSSIK